MEGDCPTKETTGTGIRKFGNQADNMHNTGIKSEETWFANLALKMFK